MFLAERPKIAAENNVVRSRQQQTYRSKSIASVLFYAMPCYATLCCALLIVKQKACHRNYKQVCYIAIGAGSALGTTMFGADGCISFAVQLIVREGLLADLQVRNYPHIHQFWLYAGADLIWSRLKSVTA